MKERRISHSTYSFDDIQPNQTNPVIPFSMIYEKHNLSPTKMACIYGAGKVDGSEFSSSTCSLFVGDRTLDSLSPFYFEITVLHPQGEWQSSGSSNVLSNFTSSVGFADTLSPTVFYQLSLVSKYRRRRVT